MITVEDSNTYYYHYDGLGSVSALSDEDGNIIEKYRYDVFGAPRIYDADDVQIDASGVSNPYMFTGRRYDTETGLYYYRARYYNPDLGRFMQTDPLGVFLQISFMARLTKVNVKDIILLAPIVNEDGLNLYLYVKNNPINWIDPSGMINPIACAICGACYGALWLSCGIICAKEGHWDCPGEGFSSCMKKCLKSIRKASLPIFIGCSAACIACAPKIP